MVDTHTLPVYGQTNIATPNHPKPNRATLEPDPDPTIPKSRMIIKWKSSPFRSAVPFRDELHGICLLPGGSTHSLTGLSPRRTCRSKSVSGTLSLGGAYPPSSKHHILVCVPRSSSGDIRTRNSSSELA